MTTANATAASDASPAQDKPIRKSFRQRLLVVICLVPVFVFFVHTGGWAFNLLISAALCVAAWEYWRIFTRGGHSPSAALLIGGVGALALLRSVGGFAGSDLLLSLLTGLALVVHLFAYEKGVDKSALDYCITVGGILYLGWLGPYLISLRSLPDGEWWFLLALPVVWLADAGAYLVGVKFGSHRLSLRISPRKTWEGFAGGLVFAMAGGAGLAALWGLRTPAVQPIHGVALGLVLGVLAPLGDLAESMIKRQFGVKDSSNLIPGHGGMMDRLDTWIWCCAISYYLVEWMIR